MKGYDSTLGVVAETEAEGSGSLILEAPRDLHSLLTGSTGPRSRKKLVQSLIFVLNEAQSNPEFPPPFMTPMYRLGASLVLTSAIDLCAPFPQLESQLRQLYANTPVPQTSHPSAASSSATPKSQATASAAVNDRSPWTLLYFPYILDSSELNWEAPCLVTDRDDLIRAYLLAIESTTRVLVPLSVNGYEHHPIVFGWLPPGVAAYAGLNIETIPSVMSAFPPPESHMGTVATQMAQDELDCPTQVTINPFLAAPLSALDRQPVRSILKNYPSNVSGISDADSGASGLRGYSSNSGANTLRGYLSNSGGGVGALRPYASNSGRPDISQTALGAQSSALASSPTGASLKGYSSTSGGLRGYESNSGIKKSVSIDESPKILTGPPKEPSRLSEQIPGRVRGYSSGLLMGNDNTLSPRAAAASSFMFSADVLNVSSSSSPTSSQGGLSDSASSNADDDDDNLPVSKLAASAQRESVIGAKIPAASFSSSFASSTPSNPSNSSPPSSSGMSRGDGLPPLASASTGKRSSVSNRMKAYASNNSNKSDASEASGVSQPSSATGSTKSEREDCELAVEEHMSSGSSVASSSTPVAASDTSSQGSSNPSSSASSPRHGAPKLEVLTEEVVDDDQIAIDVLSIEEPTLMVTPPPVPKRSASISSSAQTASSPQSSSNVPSSGAAPHSNDDSDKKPASVELTTVSSSKNPAPERTSISESSIMDSRKRIMILPADIPAPQRGDAELYEIAFRFLYPHGYLVVWSKKGTPTLLAAARMLERTIPADDFACCGWDECAPSGGCGCFEASHSITAAAKLEDFPATGPAVARLAMYPWSARHFRHAWMGYTLFPVFLFWLAAMSLAFFGLFKVQPMPGACSAFGSFLRSSILLMGINGALAAISWARTTCATLVRYSMESSSWLTCLLFSPRLIQWTSVALWALVFAMGMNANNHASLVECKLQNSAAVMASQVVTALAIVSALWPLLMLPFTLCIHNCRRNKLMELRKSVLLNRATDQELSLSARFGSKSWCSLIDWHFAYYTMGCGAVNMGANFSQFGGLCCSAHHCCIFQCSELLHNRPRSLSTSVCSACQIDTGCTVGLHSARHSCSDTACYDPECCSAFPADLMHFYKSCNCCPCLTCFIPAPSDAPDRKRRRKNKRSAARASALAAASSE